jgi:mRNA-degrading endonuclease HigB of HigAB toxin-antitoxin module
MMGMCPWPLNILSEKIARFVQFNRQEYRLIASIQYRAAALAIRFFGTHAEYDNIDAESV